IEALANRLQVSSKNILPAYEDAFFYLWKERRLPMNVEAADSKLTNALERSELARVFERGLTEPVGYVLPIRRRQNEGRLYWSSQLWFFRSQRLLLMQGDSPVGYRIPLDSLPWVAPDDIEYDYESDPFADREKLPSSPTRRADLFDRVAGDDPLPAPPQKKPADGADEKPEPPVRPALCVEAREGRLHIFLPYTPRMADYLDLLTAVEDTCLHLGRPVWLEGYPPPADPRLRSFSVTPDPGVIEVNLPPAGSWGELQHINTVVFDEARQSRLTAEKFTYDGKHKATGGGNHIVIGGPTASDSPLLRRPDLLRSMLAFWQNHPSLSYLFSGTFIGPTSQYPRVDEARMDALYELEIAFSQLPTGECPPWLVDRLFRNLLVDLTGNTHRAEFCIDKLYPPQGSGSRLGLLELRAFEMAPDVRMGLVELLLVRALVAMFWKKPYEGGMIRWGTALHDRFMLPHFVQRDFQEVLSSLQRFGYGIEERWFGPHMEFRFPKVGSIAVQDLQLELRQALEPWHVLGEESVAGATSRSVDSSLERLQVKVSGFTESRYAVICHGRRVPLRPTGPPGEAVAGVRFRAWRPPSCLHPTIPVHTPLTFDIVDLWNQRAIGGCTYHVMHPGGEWYSARPANAAEAASRRAERFQKSGSSLGRMVAPEEEANPVFPETLDLRWPAPGAVPIP
ncbi:MAG: transglutaminase family protein, partial [Acidobacteriota bacterium]|nr:transglutaminase family protein [Acidobacteriota bacterium]